LLSVLFLYSWMGEAPGTVAARLVAESSSGAVAGLHVRSDHVARGMPSVQNFFSGLRANTDPRPIPWNLCSSYQSPVTS
jgi:hypothetical protein